MPLVPLSGPAATLMEALRREGVTQAETRLAVNMFLQNCASMTNEERQVQFDQLLSIVDESPTGPACFLAVTCGALLEQGAWPGRMGEVIHRKLEEILPQAAYLAREWTRRGPGDDLPGFASDAEEEDFFRARYQQEQQVFAELSAAFPLARQAWDHFDVLWPACIALYSVDVESRVQGRKYLPVIEPLAMHHDGAAWLGKILPVLDREPLLVIDPQRQTGITALMSGVVDIYQLTGLLLEAFPRRWLERRRIDPAAVAVLQGDGPQELDLWVESHWVCYSGGVVQGTGQLPEALDILSPLALRGEMFPAEIPVFEGYRVILLKAVETRGVWQCVRPFKSLQAELSTVQVLDKAAVQEWLRRLQAAKIP